MPDPIKYRYSAGKAIAYIAISVVCIGLAIAAGGGLVAVFVIAIGLGAFAMGISALAKRKPQIILDDEGIYIGFKEKVKLPWSKVTGAVVKKEEIDSGLRKVWMLKVKAKKTKGGQTSYRVIQANIELLGIDGNKLQHEINMFRGKGDAEGEELV